MVTKQRWLRSKDEEWALQKLGIFGELKLRTLFQNLGLSVILTANIEEGGAPMMRGLREKTILPDMLVVGHGTVWAEVKYKNAPAKMNKPHPSWRHGVPAINWEHYLKTEKDTELPGYLCIYQYRPDKVEKPDPKVLVAPFYVLRETVIDGYLYENGIRIPHVFWDIDVTPFVQVAVDAIGRPNVTFDHIMHTWDRLSKDVLSPRQQELEKRAKAAAQGQLF